MCFRYFVEERESERNRARERGRTRVQNLNPRTVSYRRARSRASLQAPVLLQMGHISALLCLLRRARRYPFYGNHFDAKQDNWNGSDIQQSDPAGELRSREAFRAFHFPLCGRSGNPLRRYFTIRAFIYMCR